MYYEISSPLSFFFGIIKICRWTAINIGIQKFSFVDLNEARRNVLMSNANALKSRKLHLHFTKNTTHSSLLKNLTINERDRKENSTTFWKVHAVVKRNPIKVAF